MSKLNVKEILTEEQLSEVNKSAEDIAQELGAEDAEGFVEDTKAKLMSDNPSLQRAGARAAGAFVSKLSPLLYEQIIYNSLGTSDVYSWVNKFTGPRLNWGNSIQFSSTFSTGATTYDKTKWIPDATTDPMIEVFVTNFLKNDGTLSETSYQYKKSLSLQPKTWLPYFKSGKLSQVISNITAEMQETFRFFVVNKLQGIIKNLSDGSSQKPIAQAGENGKDLKLKTITSTAGDTFAAMLDLLTAITDLVDDVNKTNIANDSSNIRAVDLEDLVFFIPKPLIAKFRSGVLSRLPSSAQFAYDKIFSSDRVIPIGKELKPVIGNANAVIDIVQGDSDFITGNNKIVVLEKSAIQHCFVVQEHESQYFAENMIQQLTNHMWGFFAVLPFKKGFVFKCDNLLTIPSVNAGANP